MNDKTISKIKHTTIVGSIVNVLLALLKVIIGIIFQSQSLIADGLHSWSDLVTDFAIIFGVSFWNRKPDKEHPYGHGRIETFITLMIGLLLFFVALFLSYNAATSIINYKPIKPSWLTFSVAIVSIISKEILYRYNILVGKSISSKALVANAWHHRSDAFSSIPVALSVLVAKVFPNIKYTDQIATMLVSVFLIKAAYTIVSGCMDELMEKNESLDLSGILDKQKELSADIKDYHKIYIRRLGSSRYVDLHMLVERTLTVEESHALSGQVKGALMESDFHIKGVIIHIEPFIEE